MAGYLVVKGALFPDEAAACRERLQEAGAQAASLDWPELDERPVLAAYVHELCGDEAFLDQPAQPLEAPAAGFPSAVQGGNEPQHWARGYLQQNDVQLCQGLLAVWALSDVPGKAGGFHLVAASHRSNVETPAGVRDGSRDMGLWVQPALAAGDLLLCAASTLHGMRPWRGEARPLLACRFVAAEARRSLPQPDEQPPPAWVRDLPPSARAIATPSTGGPAPTVRSDGRACSHDEMDGPFHPTIYGRNPDSGIDEAEFYHWDLCGHLMLPGVMDPAWLREANEALDACADRVHQGGAPHRESQRLTGTPLASLSGLFELPPPHCEPFRAMIAHPAVVQRLNWMMGSGFRLGPARAMCYEPGSSGLYLHGGGEPARSRNHYAFQNGRTQCESVNVAWQLGDVGEGRAGSCTCPAATRPVTPCRGASSCARTIWGWSVT